MNLPTKFLLPFASLILFFSLSSPIVAQEKPKGEAKNEAKKDQVQQDSKPSTISIPTELQQVLKDKEQALKIAQLELQNIDLQIRLLLSVPNDFIRRGDNYQKPPSEVKPQELKQEPKKPE